MDNKTAGYTTLVLAFGVLLGSFAINIAQLKAWSDATSPAFISQVLLSVSSTIGAFYGGKVIPPDRDPNQRTRAADRAKLEDKKEDL